MQRREFVDWVRGFAVIAMVLWHTADGWLVPVVRAGQSWTLLRFVGGLAAPSFLFLAGAGAALAARPERVRQQPLAAALARGLEIMLFGYLLRYQTWMIDAGAAVKLYLLRAWLPLGLGYALLLLSLRTLLHSPARARWLALGGALLCLGGFAQVPSLAPGRLLRLLQVDVLQAIGASLVLLALGERSFRLLQRPRLAFVLGVAVTVLTAPLWSALPGPLPVPLAAYLGRFEPAPGQPVPALFPLFPWLAYAFFGAAFGTVLRTTRALDRTLVLAALIGATLALITSESHAFVHQVMAAQAWTVHPLRVAFRIGLIAVLLLWGWLWIAGTRGRVLVSYGRASLRSYWLHLLVAYGALGASWYKRLVIGEWAVRVVLLLAFLWLVSQVKLRAPVPLRNEAST